ncbi:MAG: hypothetical protein WD904_04055 [Dehalococcoidia bacterium]
MASEACHWAAVFLASMVIAWSAGILLGMMASGDLGNAGFVIVVPMIFGYPVAISYFLYRGVMERRTSTATTAALLYIPSILMPGLMGIVYIPALAAGLLASALQWCDERGPSYVDRTSLGIE